MDVCKLNLIHDYYKKHFLVFSPTVLVQCTYTEVQAPALGSDRPKNRLLLRSRPKKAERRPSASTRVPGQLASQTLKAMVSFRGRVKMLVISLFASCAIPSHVFVL